MLMGLFVGVPIRQGIEIALELAVLGLRPAQ